MLFSLYWVLLFNNTRQGQNELINVFYFVDCMWAESDKCGRMKKKVLCLCNHVDFRCRGGGW